MIAKEMINLARNLLKGLTYQVAGWKMNLRSFDVLIVILQKVTSEMSKGNSFVGQIVWNWTYLTDAEYNLRLLLSAF